jgi:hypothetical protein
MIMLSFSIKHGFLAVLLLCFVGLSTIAYYRIFTKPFISIRKDRIEVSNIWGLRVIKFCHIRLWGHTDVMLAIQNQLGSTCHVYIGLLRAEDRSKLLECLKTVSAPSDEGISGLLRQQGKKIRMVAVGCAILLVIICMAVVQVIGNK